MRAWACCGGDRMKERSSLARALAVAIGCLMWRGQNASWVRGWMGWGAAILGRSCSALL